jgi:hypothetical protein
MLDVLVVIPNLNGASVLPGCLAALGPAAGSRSWAAVVVDNASADESVRLVRTRFPEVSLQENPENRGFAIACNQGGRSGESRYVLLLNSDVIVPPGALDALIARMDGDQTLGALTPVMVWPDGRRQGPRLGWRERSKRPVLPMSWVPGTALLLRRAALDAIGWLDEAFFFYNEDIDLSWRLRKAGWRIGCAPLVQVVHQEGTATRSDPRVRARAILEGYRGSVHLTRKHVPWATGLVRLGLRLDVWWQARRITAKQQAGRALDDREEALLLCLPQVATSLRGALG